MNCRLRNVPFRGLHANCTSTAQTSTASFRKILSTPICSAEFPSFSDAISSKSFLTTSRNGPNRGFRILHKHLPRFGCFYRFILSDKAPWSRISPHTRSTLCHTSAAFLYHVDIPAYSHRFTLCKTRITSVSLSLHDYYFYLISMMYFCHKKLCAL